MKTYTYIEKGKNMTNSGIELRREVKGMKTGRKNCKWKKMRLPLNFPFPTRYGVKKNFSRLLELLEGNPETSHEQFKGGLFVLLGKGGKSFLTKQCWPTFEAVCPAILKASHSEKPSIVKVRNCSI